MKYYLRLLIAILFLLYLLLILASSCRTVKVGDEFGYKDSYRGPIDPLDKKSKGTYFIQCRIIAKANGFVRYKAGIFEDDSDLLAEPINDFKKDFKRIR